MKKIVSWNVNGLRAIFKKDFLKDIKTIDPDILCLQETKISEVADNLLIDGYKAYFFNSKKKGYSSTAIYTKIEPLAVKYGLGIEEFDFEGRTLIMEFEDFYIVNSYTPNAQTELKRIDYRLRYDNALKEYISELDKSVILCGDLNVAHNEIDLKNPSANRFNPGFSDEERESFTNLLNSGFIDTYRYIYPNKADVYTWWSYRFRAREKNIGWRIDYFVVDDKSIDRVNKAEILDQYYGSDHCPILIEYK